ncbi:DUF1294 domain-containing protein [Aquibacillus albus]|uniref:Uncharacterized membrane protein YsdA (DUF1294 family) n=1 Tax=Aquibacillus albus TaxID=1168171 RepID=A0ABS2N230_9BACI|nr:DUF1294 domain-containing protein [Aquibacillus albus]MBM7571965.1 uncharacterized membrane protein YsdA (DUF1294 family) [Aquibacillus albus]
MNTFMLGLIGYLLIINLLSYSLMGIDKRRARRKAWRIPEKRLWFISIIGGAFGSMVAMNAYKHKTMHRTFKYGLPILCVIQICFLLYLF